MCREIVYKGKMKAERRPMLRHFYLVAALVMLLPQVIEARVPSSMIKQRDGSETRSAYRSYRNKLKAEGYKKGLYGLDMGYQRQGFRLDAGKSIYLSPLKNMVKGEGRAAVDAAAEGMMKRFASLLDDTEMFSSVSRREKGADYTVEIYVMEQRSVFNIWTAGSWCVWGINLYDKERNLLMAGFDRISSNAYYGDAAFLIDQIADRALLFVGRANPDFNTEYRALLRMRKFNWKIWE